MLDKFFLLLNERRLVALDVFPSVEVVVLVFQDPFNTLSSSQKNCFRILVNVLGGPGSQWVSLQLLPAWQFGR